MSINEKMALMLQEKSDIRQSIVNKGVDMSGIDFLGFSEKVDEIGFSIDVETAYAQNINGVATVTIDLVETKEIVAITCGAGQRSNNKASTTLTLSCGVSSDSEITLSSASVANESSGTINYTTPVNARYIKATNSTATWNSVGLCVIYKTKIGEVATNTKTQAITKSGSATANSSNSVTYTFSNLTKVYGISAISGANEGGWLKGYTISGNKIIAIIGNNRSSGGPWNYSVTITAIGV